MKKKMLLMVSLFVISLFAAVNVNANPQGQAMDKTDKQCPKSAMKMKNHEFKKEMNAITLDTLALLKEIAPNADAVKKAEDLESRMRKLLEDKKAYYKDMYGKDGAKMRHGKGVIN